MKVIQHNYPEHPDDPAVEWVEFTEDDFVRYGEHNSKQLLADPAVEIVEIKNH